MAGARGNFHTVESTVLIDEEFVIVEVLYKFYNKIADKTVLTRILFAVEVDFDAEHELDKQN